MLRIQTYFIFLLSIFLFASSCRSRKIHSSPINHHETVKSDTNEQLRQEIKTWLGTPYKFGGSDKFGADCSGFVSEVYKKIYGFQLPRTSIKQYEMSKKIPREKLQMGDLVFFNPSTKLVSHVGIYLGQDSFAHASTSKGVVMSSLNTTYYKNCFVSGGRYELR